MENNLQVFSNEEFGEIRVRLLAGNEIEVNLEDAARGLGFTVEQTIGDKTYSNIRWDRVKDYLADIGFLPEVVKDAYIPERVFYRLTMKAKNERAVRFQGWLADVAHDIRKTGAYISPSAAITPDFLRNLADTLERAQRKIAELENAVSVQQVQIAELQPKASYYDLILQCKSAVKISVIAKDYGLSARKFNQLLHGWGVQFKQGRDWLPYQKYAELGWTQTKTYEKPNRDGELFAYTLTCWTQKGRLGIYDIAKQHGYLPKVERPEEQTLLFDEPESEKGLTE